MAKRGCRHWLGWKVSIPILNHSFVFWKTFLYRVMENIPILSVCCLSETLETSWICRVPWRKWIKCCWNSVSPHSQSRYLGCLVPKKHFIVEAWFLSYPMFSNNSFSSELCLFHWCKWCNEVEKIVWLLSMRQMHNIILSDSLIIMCLILVCFVLKKQKMFGIMGR